MRTSLKSSCASITELLQIMLNSLDPGLNATELLDFINSQN